MASTEDIGAMPLLQKYTMNTIRSVRNMPNIVIVYRYILEKLC